METEHSTHPTAIVDKRARLGEGVKIGPYVVIEGRVSIGDGTTIRSHSVLGGDTKIGRNCRIGPAAYVGLDPQHIRFKAEAMSPTFLIIGDNVTVREGARIHRAIHPGEDHATRIGDNCFIMGAVHVAHDCILERDVIMADAALLGGHCQVGRGAFLGGGCTVHQFVHIGRLAIIAGNEQLSHDVPPFGGGPLRAAQRLQRRWLQTRRDGSRHGHGAAEMLQRAAAIPHGAGGAGRAEGQCRAISRGQGIDRIYRLGATGDSSLQIQGSGGTEVR